MWEAPGPMTQLGDMDPDTFRRYGHHLVEWVADYLSYSARSRSVAPALSRHSRN